MLGSKNDDHTPLAGHEYDCLGFECRKAPVLPMVVVAADIVVRTLPLAYTYYACF
jgi:hypothetical protein